MWQGQVRLLDRDVVIGDEVDIERARAPALLVGAVAAEGAFGVLGAGEQRLRRQPGFDRDTAIDEWRLVGDAPWRGRIIGGAGKEPDGVASAEHRQRAI